MTRYHSPTMNRQTRGRRTYPEPPREYYVYVIEETQHGQKVFYVGQSGKRPEARAREHDADCKRYCRECRCRRYSGPKAHVVRLRYDLFAQYNPLDSRAEAERVESWIADRLRKQGHRVKGGH